MRESPYFVVAILCELPQAEIPRLQLIDATSNGSLVTRFIVLQPSEKNKLLNEAALRPQVHRGLCANEKQVGLVLSCESLHGNHLGVNNLVETIQDNNITLLDNLSAHGNRL